MGTAKNTTAAKIVEWVNPEIKDVALRRIDAKLSELDLDRLPESFDWGFVAQDYAQRCQIA
jgi:hypothetical protein